MSKPHAKSNGACPVLSLAHDIHENRRNCRLDVRAELWLHHGGEALDLSPSGFHRSLATWLANAGLVDRDKVTDVAAALYCLGVTNSNNLFQKVRQGKLDGNGIGRNGRRNGKPRRAA